MEHKKNIVILGAGFGGLRAARIVTKELRRLNLTEKYSVILIDRNDHHTFTPLLYEIATTSKETANLCDLHVVSAYPISSLLGNLPITFTQGDIVKIDPQNSAIHLRSNEIIPYTYLVLALGSETNFFDIPGLAEHALPLKTFVDAVRIRDTVWNLALQEKKDITIVVAGGGSTGVELASELESWCNELKETFRACRLHIALVEGNPSILPGFDPRVIRSATKRLGDIGVRVIVGKKISRVEQGILFFDREPLTYDILVWAGGVRTPQILTTLGLKTEPRGRIEVNPDMSCVSVSLDTAIAPHIYAIGDIACVYDHNQKPIPQVARAAIDQANIAAHNILEEIKSVELPRYTLHVTRYTPQSYPYILPIGGKYAIAKIGPFILKGILGWITKGFVELRYLLSIMPVTRAFAIWFKAFRIFIKNDRLG